MDYNDPYNGTQKGKVYTTWYTPSISAIIFWLLVFGGFIFLIWIVTTQNATTHHVHNVMSKIDTINESPKGGKLVGVSSIMGGGSSSNQGDDDENEKLSRKIRLCSKEVYYTKYGEWNDTLMKVNMSIEDLLTSPLVNSYFHPISVTLEIEFNTNVVDSSESTQTKSLLELNPTMKFMLFTYNITTNYPFFSTVNLMELEFDPFGSTLRPPRTISMCSNNNDIITRRCDHRGDEKIITIHNKNLRPLATVRSQRKSSTEKAADTTTPQTKQPIVSNNNNGAGSTNSGNTDEEMYDMIGAAADNSYSHADSQKSEISGLRLYNVVFYKKNQDKQFISHNPNSRNNNNNNMREEKVLTLELKHC